VVHADRCSELAKVRRWIKVMNSQTLYLLLALCALPACSPAKQAASADAGTHEPDVTVIGGFA
jgi:hypothetical protein